MIELVVVMTVVVLLILLGMLLQNIILHLYFRAEHYKQARNVTACFMVVYFIVMVVVFIFYIALGLIL
jgi:hypothetical protein